MTLLVITGAILILSLSVLVLTYTAKRFGRPEDDLIEKLTKNEKPPQS
jgi:hypothetical protein